MYFLLVVLRSLFVLLSEANQLCLWVAVLLMADLYILFGVVMFCIKFGLGTWSDENDSCSQLI